MSSSGGHLEGTDEGCGCEGDDADTADDVGCVSESIDC